MGDERRWAARYQFLDELWRGRDRIVCDRELEAALHAGLEGSLAELLDGLVPRADEGGRAWVALHNHRRAAGFARERAGTVFVALDEAAEIAADEGWQVALVNLEGGQGSRAELLGDGVEAFLEVLGERLEDDRERSVVLSLACGPDEDQSYEQLAELVEELFGDGRIYGLARPGMAAFYDFGPIFEPGLEPAAEADEASGAEAPEVEVDNSLGSETPRFEVFVAVVGARIPGEGVVFVELPAPNNEHGGASRFGAGASTIGDGSSTIGGEELAAVRAQLGEAQRRGDMQAIERQTLLEKLEQAEDRNAALEEQLEAARAEVSGSASEELEADDQSRAKLRDQGRAKLRLDEVLAREQTLRWELERLRGELERLEARPVEALEAELARSEAELAQAREQLAGLETELEERTDDESAEDEDELDLDLDSQGIELLLDGPEPTPAQVREWRRARSRLDHLMQKLERGGRLSALELHRELARLRRQLA